MYKILVAEDDIDIVQILRLYLENDNMKILAANDGIAAMEILKNEKVDIAILDIMMPRMDGYQLTAKIRENSDIPIIILSAKISDADKILGLNIGADDYMTKPFNPLEIVARVKANLRRYYGMPKEVSSENIYTYKQGDLVLDMEKMTIFNDNREIELTSTEFKILSKMMKSPGRVFTKSQLYEAVKGEFFESDDNTMMVHISKIREKMGDKQYIKTVRGLGYKFEVEE